MKIKPIILGIISSAIFCLPVLAAPSPSSKTVVDKAIANFSKAKSFEFMVTYKRAQTEGKGYGTPKAYYRYDGQVDISEEKNEKIFLNTDFSFDGSVIGQSSFNMLSVGQKIFVKMIYSNSGEIDRNNELVKISDGKWMRMDSKSARGVLINKKDGQKIEEIRRQVNRKKLSDLIALLKQNKVYTLSALKDAKIKGVDCHHYKIIFNRENFSKFAVDASQLWFNKKYGKKDRASLAKYWKQNTLPFAEVWISKKDLNISRLIFAYEGVVRPSTKKEAGVKEKISYDWYFQSYGKKMDITEPAYHFTEKEMIDALFHISSTSTSGTTGSIYDKSRIEIRDAERIANLKQIQTALELYYADFHAYPAGNGILGFGYFKCLNAQGWQPEYNCRSAYFGQVPSDPGGGYYYYSLDKDYYHVDTRYHVDSRLEGTYQNLHNYIRLTPDGIIQWVGAGS